jgi:DNA/RNA endonuclease YhcR with UshA esterase domain
MKKIISIFSVVVIAAKLFAADTNSFAVPKISAFEATNYYDQTVVVTGKVAQVTIRPKVTFLNLDKPYPRSPIAIVIFHGHSRFFGDVNVLRGKSIEIKGEIKNYKDRPEIILDSINQLTVVGVTNLELFLKPKSELKPATAPPAAQSTNFPAIM